MANIDYTPLFRTAVGFENVPRLVKAALSLESSELSYPPYNIEKTGENEYRITFAVAGFTRDDIEITTEPNRLSVRGHARSNSDAEYLYRGIAGRPFERTFDLADFVEVRQAELENGLLTIDLVRELPEQMKPRKIQIGSTVTKLKTIEHSKEDAA